LNHGGGVRKKITLKPKQKLVLYKQLSDYKIQEVDETPESLEESDLMAEQQTSVDKKSSLYMNVDTETYTSWKDGKLIFRNEPLDVLADRLEKWYDVNIQISDKSLMSKTYTGVFEKETVEQALKAICLTSNIHFEIDKNNITISK
jgi:ferric-dicitrate binding protein FerR (iron transport regulator)